MEWDAGLLDLFGVPAALLPGRARLRRVRPATRRPRWPGFEAPVAAMLGDQPAALYGQGCTSPRMAALTLGTGAFVWLNAGPDRPDPPEGVLATVAWQTAREGRTYALEAFGANAGNALGVLRGSGLVGGRLARRGRPTGAGRTRRRARAGRPGDAALARRRPDHGGRRDAARTTADDLAAAWLAGVAHQITDALEAQEASGGIDVLRVGGGLAADRALLQAVADLSGLVLEVARRPRGDGPRDRHAGGHVRRRARRRCGRARGRPPGRAGARRRRPGARAGPLARRPRGARAASGPG